MALVGGPVVAHRAGNEALVLLRIPSELFIGNGSADIVLVDKVVDRLAVDALGARAGAASGFQMVCNPAGSGVRLLAVGTANGVGAVRGAFQMLLGRQA